MKTLRMGTRPSRLALWQAEWVANRLRTVHSQLSIELVAIETRGEKQPTASLAKEGSEGIFTDELEEALLGGDIDMAVHSLKDLPDELPSGLTIAAYGEREDARDVLISSSGALLSELPPASRIGTSSVRRAAQVLRARPDVVCVDIRGNIEERLRKLDETQDYEGIILAAAGLKRLGLSKRITEYFDEERFLPAMGQGIIAVETVAKPGEILSLLAPINHRPSELEARAEYGFLQALGESCQAPIGARARYCDGLVCLEGIVVRPDGAKAVQVQSSGVDPQAVGAEAARLAEEQGAKELLYANSPSG